MGCNYYCKYKKQKLHIGKSSYGWHFILCIYPELGISCLDDWQDVWLKNSSKIKNEYNETISIADMLNIITNRTVLDPGETQEQQEAKELAAQNALGNRQYRNYEEYMKDNCATRGINGLLAHEGVEFYRTNGTYDLTTITEFC